MGRYSVRKASKAAGIAVTVALVVSWVVVSYLAIISLMKSIKGNDNEEFFSNGRSLLQRGRPNGNSDSGSSSSSSNNNHSYSSWSISFGVIFGIILFCLIIRCCINGANARRRNRRGFGYRHRGYRMYHPSSRIIEIEMNNKNSNKNNKNNDEADAAPMDPGQLQVQTMELIGNGENDVAHIPSVSVESIESIASIKPMNNSIVSFDNIPVSGVNEAAEGMEGI